MVSSANDYDPPIQHWQDHLAGIYLNEGVSDETMMLHVYSWCSEIGRLVIRKDTSIKRAGTYLPEIDRGVVKTISWIVALSERLDLSLEESMIDRFPSACPHCILPVCGCDRQGRRFITERGFTGSAADAAAELAIKKSSIVGFPYAPGRLDRPISFSWMINNLQKIYPGNATLLHKGSDTLIVSKLLEECGEIFSAYCEWKQTPNVGTSNLKEEVADLTAWLLTCWDIENSGRSIDGAMQDIFGKGCPKCHRPVCKCEFLFTSLVRTTEARRFRDELDSMSISEEIRDRAIDMAGRIAGAETSAELEDAGNIARLFLDSLPKTDESIQPLLFMTKRLVRFTPL